MRTDVYQLDAPTGVAVGEALKVADYSDKYIQAVGITNTIKLEGTINGTDWADLIAAITNGFTSVPQNVAAVRCNRTGAGAGTVHLIGRGRSAE